MSKVKSDQLFRLIHSLSKSEKRQFKLFASRQDTGEKKFLLLFDEMAAQEVYDEHKLLKKHKALLPHQMPNMKAHLYRQILKCLQLANVSKLPEMQISELIDYSRILYSKCLYKECLQMIEKAKRLAVEYDSRVFLLELLDLEKMAIRQQQGLGDTGRTEKIVSETNVTSQSVQNINSFSNLSLRLNSFYQNIGFIRNREDHEKVKSFFQSGLPEYNESRLTFQEKLYLYSSFTGYYFFIRDTREGYRYARKWMQLFEDHPEMICLKTEMYIKALNSLLVAQNKLYLYNEFMQTHHKLVSLKRDKNIIHTENINLHLFRTIYIHEINRHFMLGEFKSGTRIVSRLQNELNNFIPKLDKHTVLVLYYKIACLYFGSSNFKESIKWLNYIINEKETETREDLHSFSRILRLICYFELEDDDRVENNIRSTYRFLLQKKSFVKYQQLIMQFLKGLRKDYSKKEITARFVKLKKQMENLEKDKYERRAFLYFDIISWLESRIEGRVIQDVVREKAVRRIASGNRQLQ
ncbi:MAG: hypothetical protein ACOZCO_17045 [Bacteroidota bacterium]